MTNTAAYLDKSSSDTDETLDRPTVNVKYAPSAPVVDSPILVEADHDESGVEYEWEFSDGSTATGRKASNIFDSAGEQSITLTATDGDGRTETVRQTLTVYREANVEICERDCGDEYVTVVIRGDSDFDPAGSVAVDSLRFGAPTALAMGSGSAPVETDARDGDLRVQFPRPPGDSAGRLAGRTADGVPLAGTASTVDAADAA
ncbi:PKD domain-containing protein [Halorussus ruber]|uniref:PKD domain-containing protein n=1 Tax=Halorussus ruber TaxID=1126238 RepID=UPI001092AF75|nr:PKD domain-containing protein [Halorussus ruber]